MLSSDVLIKGLLRLEVFRHICERHKIELYKLVWGAGVGVEGVRGAVQKAEGASFWAFWLRLGFLLGLLLVWAQDQVHSVGIRVAGSVITTGLKRLAACGP